MIWCHNVQIKTAERRAGKLCVIISGGPDPRTRGKASSLLPDLVKDVRKGGNRALAAVDLDGHFRHEQQMQVRVNKTRQDGPSSGIDAFRSTDSPFSQFFRLADMDDPVSSEGNETNPAFVSRFHGEHTSVVEDLIRSSGHVLLSLPCRIGFFSDLEFFCGFSVPTSRHKLSSVQCLIPGLDKARRFQASMSFCSA